MCIKLWLSNVIAEMFGDITAQETWAETSTPACHWSFELHSSSSKPQCGSNHSVTRLIINHIADGASVRLSPSDGLQTPRCSANEITSLLWVTVVNLPWPCMSLIRARYYIIASYGDRSFARKLHSALSRVHLRRILLWFQPSVCSQCVCVRLVYTVQNIGLFRVRAA